MPVRGRVQDRLVDDVIVSVPAPHRLKAVDAPVAAPSCAFPGAPFHEDQRGSGWPRTGTCIPCDPRRLCPTDSRTTPPALVRCVTTTDGDDDPPRQLPASKTGDPDMRLRSERRR
jgi:hypothetical protein